MADRPAGIPTTVYEENVGQVDGDVRFVSRRPGYTLYVTDAEAVMTLTSDEGLPSSVVRQRLVGARAATVTRGLDGTGGTTSYIKGADSSEWVQGAPHFGRVLQEDVYEGVDVVWHGGSGGAEYDFVVEPGASHEQIAVTFDGPRSVRIEGDGSLSLVTRDGTLSHRTPVAYQEIDGERRIVACAFEARDDASIGFDVGEFDETVALVIDPFVEFATFLGGSAHDHARAVVKRPYGETFVAGYTSSLDFPIPGGGTISTGGDFDAFVYRYDALGTGDLFIFGGSLDDRAYGVFASKDEVWICGETQSPDLPTTGGSVQGAIAGEVDGFFAGFTHAGGLVYGSYLGGTWNDVATQIQIAEDDSVVVGGRTVSLDFPSTANATQPTHGGTNGAFDAFVSRLNPARSALDFSTFYGGEASELLYDLEVTSTGEIYICGYTNSNFLPVTPSAFQELSFTFASGFVARLDPSIPDVVYSTYLAGYGWSWCNDIAVDAAGAAYVTGYTDNIDFPTTAGAFQEERLDRFADAFVTKLSPDGSFLEYSTYLGGRGMESGNGIWVRSSGEAVVVGSTGSAEFPVTEAADQTVYHGGGNLYQLRGDAFVARLSADGTDLEYGQFLGSCEWETGEKTSEIRILPSDVCPVPVANSGFESPVLGVPYFTPGVVDGWEVTGGGGTFAPASYAVFNGGQVTDDQTAYSDGGTIRQVLDHTLLPLARYTVTVDVLDRTDAAFPGYDIRLLAGDDPYGDGVTDWDGFTTITELASEDESFGVPANGDALTVTFTFDTTWSTPEIGQTLGIELSATGSQVNFDAVSVVVEPLPSDDLFDVVGDTASSTFPIVSPTQGTFGGVHDATLASFNIPDGNATVLATVAPHDLRVTLLGTTSMELTWEHDIPDLEFRTSSTITHIGIQRADSLARVYTTIATIPIGSFTSVGTQTYTDIGLTPSTGYQHRVIAIGTHDCDFGSSDIACGTLPQLPSPLMQRPEVPATPVDVVVGQVDPKTFVVQWTPGPLDPGGGFEVLRSEGGGDVTAAGIVSADVTQITDRTDAREPDVTYVVLPLGDDIAPTASLPYTVFRSESLGLGVLRGRVTDSRRADRDSFRASGRLMMDEANFDPRIDGARIVFGSAGAPYGINVPAGDSGWSARRGRLVWNSKKSALTGIPTVKLTLDAKRNRFRVQASHLEFPAAQSVEIVGMGLRLGQAVGGDQGEYRAQRGRTRKLRR